MASASSSPPQNWTYNVFLSFRGEDTRKNFTDHLYTALVQSGIHTFRDDDELPRGQDISSELLKAIQGSRISIIVFSKDYASSRWCLDELAKILECKKDLGQHVIPIFYDVAPSDVRNQTGCFSESFSKHENRFADDMERVEKWRDVLHQVADLPGWYLQNVANGHEAKFIQKIVDEVFRLVPTFLNVAAHPVGLNSRVDTIKKLLCVGSDDVCILGIYGMGGIGKTTIAKAVYNLTFPQFEGSCFLANVREVAEKNGLVHLQKEIMSELLKKEYIRIGNVDKGMSVMKERLHSKRVLIVLDDVDQFCQLNSLAGNRNWFGSGSRIIITTRDEHLLKILKVDEMYEATELNDTESLQLLCWHAFGQPIPIKNYAGLADSIIHYAGGLPLALEVLGSYLFDCNELQWRSAFEKLQKIPHNDIQEKLRISFDALKDDDKAKDIFLDIACFFIGMDKDDVMTILDACDFFPEIGIHILIRRCLLKVENNRLQMHNLLRDMGREIVRQESPKEPGKRSRLWFHEDVLDVLQNHKGTKAIEGISVSLPMLKDLHWNTKAFARMQKLRLLWIDHATLSGSLENLSEGLRLLHWQYCPMKYLPSDIHLDKLVHLDMRFSKIKKLGVKSLTRMKILDLSFSRDLIETPDFTGLPSLEILKLDYCARLSKVHASIGLLDRLFYWSMRSCKSLRCLPSSINKLRSLKYLDQSFCFNPDELPEKPLHSSVAHLKNPMRLSSSIPIRTPGYRSFLPSTISGLSSLKELNLSYCGLHGGDLPVDLGYLSSLHILNLSGNNFHRLASCFSHLQISGLSSLQKLFLRRCNLHDGNIPVWLFSSSSLRYLDLSENYFHSLPYLFSHLSKLETLLLDDCPNLQSVPELPPNLRALSTRFTIKEIKKAER